MLTRSSGWFRDLSCFLAYSLVLPVWLDTGYAQQKAETAPVPVAAAALRTPR